MEDRFIVLDGMHLPSEEEINNIRRRTISPPPLPTVRRRKNT
jgi:hypothetical protein